jgi:hypothetical protein
MTLAMGHHAETRHTARNFYYFPHDSSKPNNKLYIIICDWGRQYSQVRSLAKQEVSSREYRHSWAEDHLSVKALTPIRAAI